jgi:RHS repeat-associated protein
LLAEFRMPDSIAELDTAIVYNLVQESNDILNPPPPVRQYSWLWGQVLYTHGLGMDQPLAVHRAGVGVDTLDLSSFAMYPLHDWRGNATAIAFAGGRPLFNGNVQYTPPLPTDENKLLTAYRERTHDSRRVTSWMGSLLTGQMTAMGLEYRRNRYYDPKSGRFTQEDPIGLGGGLNLYGFGGGDPVNYSDPLGLCPGINGTDPNSVNDCPEESGRSFLDRFWNGPRYVEVKGQRFPTVKLEMPAVSPTGGAAELEGTALARALGRAGEEASGLVRNTSRIASLTRTAAYRIPDGLTETTLSEVKNVSRLGRSNQLRDFAAHSSQQGFNFDLYIRADTKLTGPLQQFILDNKINIRYLQP